MRRARRGFTLLEVMIALSILVITLVVLAETQATAAQMTWEADRIITATNLAQLKLTEVRALVEFEGFTTDDVHEEGDFDDFGDAAIDIEMRDLDEYHYEFLITELDLGLAGDLAGLMSNVTGAAGIDGENAPAGAPDLSSLPISEDMIVEMIQPFIREARVRVWWGEDLDEAEELGNEVVVTTHIINPQGNMLGAAGLGGGGGLGALGGAGGAGNPFGAAGAGNPFGGGAGNPFGGGGAGNPFGGGGNGRNANRPRARGGR